MSYVEHTAVSYTPPLPQSEDVRMAERLRILADKMGEEAEKGPRRSGSR